MSDCCIENIDNRSGDFRDIQRVEATCRRWQRDIPYLKYCSYGRYAPSFCRKQSGNGVELLKYTGTKEDFYQEISAILSRRFYQPESRRKYLGALKRFLNWLTIPLNRINSKCVYAYTFDLLKTGMKPATYSLHLSALRTIFDSICDLDITSALALPDLKMSHSSQNSGSLLFPNTDAVEKVISYRHSVRDRAFFATLLILNLKVNEVLNLRRKDIFPDQKKMKIWAGFGRKEVVNEVPDLLLEYLCARIDEIEEDDYLFSRVSDSAIPLSGKGANWVLKGMFAKVGVSIDITCKQILMHEFKDSYSILKTFAPSAPSLKRSKYLKFHSKDRTAGHLNIEIGELVSRKGVVSANVKIVVKSSERENILLKKVSVSECGGNGAHVKYPSLEKWEEELIWITREERDRITAKETRGKLSEIILSKYNEKRKNCYIRKERVYPRWRRSG
jgi:site-specific recombinase XerD